MDQKTQFARAEELRKLHGGSDILLLPAVWDAITARLLAAQGFPALATTSGGVAWALGYGDGEQAPLAEILAALKRITRVVDVPVTVDFEGGYGSTAEAIGLSVAEVISAGAAGINLEDSLPGHGPLREIDDAAARIRAAREAAQAAGVPIVINARIDTWLSAEEPRAPLADALARGRAYLEAGADCVYPIGLLDLDVIRDFTGALGAPVNIMGIGATPNLVDLRAAGVARISTATALTTLALGAVQQAMQEVRRTGTFAALATDFTYMEAQQLLGK